MRGAWIWLAAATMLAACNGDKNNSPANDMGGADIATSDTSNNGTDAADMGQPDTSRPPDMTTLPDGVFVPGLSGDVTVRFDAKGVLHLACTTAEDCFAVQGYYHAAHRFLSMDVQRRFTTGRLAGLIGNAALSIDVTTRALMSTRDGQPLEDAMWEAATDDTKRYLSAYTRGVNAWLDDLEAGRNGARLSDEYELPLIDQDAPILRWREQDSLACGLLLLDRLSNSSGGDIARGTEYPLLSAPQAFDLLGTMSATQVATMPSSGETYDHVAPPGLRQFPDARRMQPALDRLKSRRSLLADAHAQLAALERFRGSTEGLNGSNNWVLSGAATSSGQPLLANDPHLGLQNPALWYLVQIDARGGADELHLAGVSLPGFPGILLGHNEHIAWGGTVVFMDLADVYVEELTPDGGSVVFNGNPVPMVEVEHSFEVARGNPVTRTLRFVPHHGPVLSYDEASGEALSIRWVGNDVTTDLEMFLGLFKATTVAEARTAIANSMSSNQNWIVADRDGNIGWFPFNAVPRRPWASLDLPPWLPLPGDGSAEWGPRWSIDDLPQMQNPANGYIGTANTDPVGTSFDGDPTNDPYGYLYSFGEVGGFRQDAVIRELVAGGNTHTVATMQAMQGSSFLVLRDWVRPHVQTVVESNAGALSSDATAFWDTIADWNGECPAGIDGRDPNGAKTADAAEAAASIGCAAFHFLLFELARATFADELNPTSVDYDSRYLTRSLVVLLNDPGRLQAGADAYWDNVLTDGPPETQTSITLAAIEAASAKIRADVGPNPDDWRWGRVHTVTFFANLFNDAGFRQFDEGPYAAPGGLHAINVADPRSPSSDDWGFRHGPSMRHVSEFTATGIRSYWSLPGGQRHFRDSPHYEDLVDDWLAVRYFEMPFEPDAVSAAAVETITVSPRP